MAAGHWAIEKQAEPPVRVRVLSVLAVVQSVLVLLLEHPWMQHEWTFLVLREIAPDRALRQRFVDSDLPAIERAGQHVAQAYPVPCFCAALQRAAEKRHLCYEG